MAFVAIPTDQDEPRRPAPKQQPYNFAIGELVEAWFEEWFGEGAGWVVHARLWVVGQSHDPFGCPTYSLSRYQQPRTAEQHAQTIMRIPEAQLAHIELTADLLEGRVPLGLSRMVG
jgi:hypothetical protein